MFDLIDTLGRAFLSQARTQVRAETLGHWLPTPQARDNLDPFPSRDEAEPSEAAAA